MGNFQFLSAFLSLVLREAASLKEVPLHHVEWTFEFTEEPSPDPAFLLLQICRQDAEEGKADSDSGFGNGASDSSKNHNPVGDEENSPGGAVDVPLKGQGEEDSKASSNSGEAKFDSSLTKWKLLSKNGVLVYGLWLVGAAWDPHK